MTTKTIFSSKLCNGDCVVMDGGCNSENGFLISVHASSAGVNDVLIPRIWWFSLSLHHNGEMPSNAVRKHFTKNIFSVGPSSMQPEISGSAFSCTYTNEIGCFKCLEVAL